MVTSLLDWRAILKSYRKKERDHTLPSSYRPISLINVDVKILLKIMAERLSVILPTITHPNQQGFIKKQIIGTKHQEGVDGTGSCPTQSTGRPSHSVVGC